MKHIYGIIGIVIGLFAFLIGVTSAAWSDAAGIGILGGIFIFGCGLIAAAVGAKK